MANFWYHEGGSLGAMLCDVVDFYQNDRQKAWSDDPAAVRLLAFVDSSAEDLLNAGSDLRLAGDLAERWDSVQDLVGYLRLSADITEKLQILVARHSCSAVDESARRCADLTDLLIRGEPNEAVSRYMRRLGRCYIAGFLPECVMLCRAVLENAVIDVFDRERIALRRLEPNEGVMKVRLETLLKLQRISADARMNAWTIWARGNTAVHKDPEAVTQVRETIVLTLAVLKELYSPQ